ncbi:unnamed protein product, partial [Discosporangium mesarthrocarpum]
MAQFPSPPPALVPDDGSPPSRMRLRKAAAAAAAAEAEVDGGDAVGGGTAESESSLAGFLVPAIPVLEGFPTSEQGVEGLHTKGLDVLAAAVAQSPRAPTKSHQSHSDGPSPTPAALSPLGLNPGGGGVLGEVKPVKEAGSRAGAEMGRCKEGLGAVAPVGVRQARRGRPMSPCEGPGMGFDPSSSSNRSRPREFSCGK